MLLARQGVALDDSVQTRSNLLATLLKSPAAIGVIGGDGDPLASLDLSPDGRTLAFLDTDGTLSSVDPGTRRPLAPRRTMPGFRAGPGGDRRSWTSATTAPCSRSPGRSPSSSTPPPGASSRRFTWRSRGS